MGNEVRFIIPQRIELMAENPTLVYAQALEMRNGYAHEWQVHVLMGGRDVDLTGCTVACYAARSDKKTVRIGGEILAGCIASVVFDPTVYAIVGEVAACMELIDSAGHGKTIARLYCRVSQTGTDVVIDPGEEIPSLNNLMAMVDQMKAATLAAENAAAAAQAAAQSANFVVIGHYDTAEELAAAHPTGNRGDAYAIGTAEPYVVYIWDVDKQAWKNIGQLQGAAGAQGPTGAAGRGVSSVVLTSGDHSPGTLDTYTMYFTDSTSMQYMVYNGADGKEGAPGKDGSDAQAIVYTINGEKADNANNFSVTPGGIGAATSGHTHSEYAAKEHTHDYVPTSRVNQDLNTNSAATFASVTAGVVYGAVFME